ncbi:MAG: hypothetical protein Q7R30_05120 [Acidobacteriota bacterium]|nr:hypothetical protein [Acidobacteriota bacterium]
MEVLMFASAFDKPKGLSPRTGLSRRITVPAQRIQRSCQIRQQ